jgi:hypothetical protein
MSFVMFLMPFTALSVFKAPFWTQSYSCIFLVYSLSERLGFVNLFAYSCKGFMFIYFDELSSI